MQVKNIDTKDFKLFLKSTRALINFPGADTTLTFSAKRDYLTVCAATSGIKVRRDFDADIIKSGKVTVDVAHVDNLFLPKGSVSISTKDGSLIIRSGRGVYKLKSESGEGPKRVRIPEAGKNTIQVQIGVLLGALKEVWFNQDETGSGDVRYIIGKKLIVETGDSTRGVVFSKNMSEWKKIESSKHFVFKKRRIEDILRCFDSDDTVNLDVSSSDIKLYLSDQLVEVPVPLTSNLVEIHSAIRDLLKGMKKLADFKINSDSLADMATAAASLSDGNNKNSNDIARMLLKEKSMVLKSVGDIGSYQTKIGINDLKGSSDLNVAVLSRYLKEIVDTASKSGEKLMMEIWDNCVILKSIGSKHKCMYVFSRVKE